MSDNNGGDVGAFLAGFVIGGLVGAATAMILAPKSGAEMRAQLMNMNAEEWRHAGQERFESMRTSAAEAGTAAQERIRIVLDEGKSRVKGSEAQSAATATPNGADAPEEHPSGTAENGDASASA
jgi:gas vesicle protein